MRANSAPSSRCETRDKYLGADGVMNEGLLASWLGLAGIPREAEIIPLERDLRIAELTRGTYHAAKISRAGIGRGDRTRPQAAAPTSPAASRSTI